MNKKTLIIFALFICGCTPQALPNLLPQLISSGNNNQSNVSASPAISTSASPASTVTPQISPTTASSTSSSDISGSGNPNATSSPTNISPSGITDSSKLIGTIKINVPINYANSYLASQAKSVTVIITDDTGKISTISLSSSGGDITIPTNTKTITLNALDSSNRVISTITQNVNFSNNTNTDIVLQANFSNSVNSSGSSGGSGFSGGSSGGGAPPNPDIPVNATVRPDNTSVK